MDNTTTPSNHLPLELAILIVDLVRDQKPDLARLARASRTFYAAATPHIYTRISLFDLLQGPKSEWVKVVSRWARTLGNDRRLGSLVKYLELPIPECDLPALYRQTLRALQSCVNLRELEICHESHNTPTSWLFPDRPNFTLDRFVSFLPASAGVARILESQPSIRTLRLETLHLQLPLGWGSLPNLVHYTGSSKLISQARVQGAIWDHLVHAQLHDAYRPNNRMLEPMPRLRSLDLTVAGWNNESMREIATNCPELRHLTLRDANALFHSWQDGRLTRFATAPSFTSGLAAFTNLSSLTINAVYPLHRGRVPVEIEMAQLMEWHAHCPTLRHFNSPTALEWVFAPASKLPTTGLLSLEEGLAGQWLVVSGPNNWSLQSAFATDPEMFGMRRAGSMTERANVGDIDELIAFIERLNHERQNDQ